MIGNLVLVALFLAAALLLVSMLVKFWFIWVPTLAIVVALVTWLRSQKLKQVKANLVEICDALPEGEGFLVFDFETSGLYPDQGERAVQLGVIALDQNLAEVGRFQTIFNPQHAVGPTEIHGITKPMTYLHPKFHQLAPQFHTLFNGRTVIAHNVEFDAGFLASEFNHSKYSQPTFRKIDTLDMARTILIDSSDHKLATVVNHLNIDISNSPGRGSHDAITDTWYVLQIFLAMLDQVKLDPKILAYE